MKTKSKLTKEQSKKLEEYKKYLKEEAEKFRLTAEDLTNLTDLGMMIPWWVFEGTIKLNKMDKWFIKFFNRIEEITIPEINEDKEEKQ